MLGGVYHAFLYSAGVMTDLGTLGGLSSYGSSINVAGQVVGSASTPGGTLHPFLYGSGVMTDLNTLIDPVPGITLNGASAINDAGQIVATGGGHAYRLDPVAAGLGNVPEPNGSSSGSLSRWALCYCCAVAPAEKPKSIQRARCLEAQFI